MNYKIGNHNDASTQKTPKLAAGHTSQNRTVCPFIAHYKKGGIK